MGGVTSIPPSFSISFALACASSINAAVHAYGLLLTSSRPSTLASHSSPFELRFLGYATDNGAYYYYKVKFVHILEIGPGVLLQLTLPSGSDRRRVQCNSVNRY